MSMQQTKSLISAENPVFLNKLLEKGTKNQSEGIIRLCEPFEEFTATLAIL